MTWLYGGVFGGTPAPTPAMMDAHVEKRDAGEDGFLHDEAPKFGVKPNRRLDGKAHLMEYERWNRDWARGSGDDPKGLAPEYEQYIRDLDKDHGHDPGLIFARDLTQQVEKYHGKGGELAKQFVTLLADRPDLQREYLGGEVPKAPPIGTFKPGGEEGVKAWIDQDRVANGLKPRYAIPISTNTRNTAPALPTSSRTTPAAQDTPDPKNLLEYGPNFGLPEDEGLRQATAHDAERARQAAQNEQRPVPEHWPEGQPPTAEDWGLHQNPPHTPDLPNPQPTQLGDGSQHHPPTNSSPNRSETDAAPDRQSEGGRHPPSASLDDKQLHVAHENAVLAHRDAMRVWQDTSDQLRSAEAERAAAWRDIVGEFGSDALQGGAEGFVDGYTARRTFGTPRDRYRPGRDEASDIATGAAKEAAPGLGARLPAYRSLDQQVQELARQLPPLQQMAEAARLRREELARELETRRNGRTEQR